MKPRIIIAGAGFAGLSAYLTLRKHDVEILLFDQDRFFEYTPSLHMCLGNRSYEKKILIDLRRYEGYRNERIIKVSEDRVHTRKGSYRFDFLIVATGSRTNLFGKADFQKHAFPLRRMKDVRLINAKLNRAKIITVVGGGCTGVEVASVLATLGKRVNLIHPKVRVLDTLPKRDQGIATKWLRNHNVTLHLKEHVEICKEGKVRLASGRTVASDLTIMTAGMKPNDEMLDNPMLRKDISLLNNDRIFLAGDVGKSGTLPTAHNAMIEGRVAANRVLDRLDRPTSEMAHKDWKILAVALGHNSGIITLPKQSIYLPVVGFIKWIIEKRVMIEFKRGLKFPL